MIYIFRDFYMSEWMGKLVGVFVLTMAIVFPILLFSNFFKKEFKVKSPTGIITILKEGTPQDKVEALLKTKLTTTKTMDGLYIGTYIYKNKIYSIEFRNNKLAYAGKQLSLPKNTGGENQTNSE